MPTITRPAVEIRQGHLTIYLTYVTPRDLSIPRFYDVEHLEPQGGGYQRILNSARANRLARHLSEGLPMGYANLPTTIFLATEKPVTFSAEKNEIYFETEDVCPFSVVDGQHRIEGLLKSFQNHPEMADFKLPATIAVLLDDTHQMYHFYIVNTTQQPVEAALQQQITRRFTDMKGIQNLPYLPYWLENLVASGADALSLKLAEFLNEDSSSPLQDRIAMANDPGPVTGKIRQASLVTMFKNHVFNGVNPLYLRELDPDKRVQIMLNYFRAIDQLFVGSSDRTRTIVYKNNGLFFFLSISKWVFTSIYASSDPTFAVDSIAQTIKRGLDAMEYPWQEICDPSWWLPGRGSRSASSLNRANATLYANHFLQGLQRAGASGGEG